MADQREWTIFVCVVCGQHDEPADCPTQCGHQDGVRVVPAARVAELEAKVRELNRLLSEADRRLVALGQNIPKGES